MAYTPTYTADDYAPIFIDTVGLVGATVNENIPPVVTLVMISIVLIAVVGIITLLFSGLLGGLMKAGKGLGKSK